MANVEDQLAEYVHGRHVAELLEAKRNDPHDESAAATRVGKIHDRFALADVDIDEVLGAAAWVKMQKFLKELKLPLSPEPISEYKAIPAAVLRAAQVKVTRGEMARWCFTNNSARYPLDWVIQRQGDIGRGVALFSFAEIERVHGGKKWTTELLEVGRARMDSQIDTADRYYPPRAWVTVGELRNFGATDTEIDAMQAVDEAGFAAARREIAVRKRVLAREADQQARRIESERQAAARIESIREHVTVDPSVHIEDEPLDPVWGDADGNGVLLRNSNAAIVGERGTLKSVAIHHIVVAAMLGIDSVLGHPVYMPRGADHHRVLMVVGEAEDMVWTNMCVAARNLGWTGAASPLTALKDRLIVIPRIELDTEAGRAVVAEFAAMIEPTIFVNDTYAKNRSAEMNENSSTDAYAIINGVDDVLAPYDPLKVYVHHTARSSDFARGSGAFEQALDTVILTSKKRKGDPTTATTSKLKRGPEGVVLFTAKAEGREIPESDMRRDWRGNLQHGVAVVQVDPQDNSPAGDTAASKRASEVDAALQAAILQQVCTAITNNEPLAVSKFNRSTEWAVKSVVQAVDKAMKGDKVVPAAAVANMVNVMARDGRLLVKCAFSDLGDMFKGDRQNGSYLRPAAAFPVDYKVEGAGIAITPQRWAEIVEDSLTHHGLTMRVPDDVADDD